ncbi:MAG: hypothetical protein QM730_07110 [Anaerolineales bacterium]
MKPYLKQVGKLLLLIVSVQLARGLVFTGLWKVLQPQGDSIQWVIMDMIAFCVVGEGLLLLFAPSPEQLSLEWTNTPRWERITYLAGGGLILLLVGISIFMGHRHPRHRHRHGHPPADVRRVHFSWLGLETIGTD